MKLLQEVDSQAAELMDVRELIAAIQGAAPFFRSRGDGDTWLYRGMNESLVPRDNFVRILKSRPDRKPKDSPYIIHETLDKQLVADFGIPFRSVGTFCTGDSYTAAEYGKAAVILPQGDFQFCWGIQVKDAYARFDLAHAYNYIATHAKDLNQQPTGLQYPAPMNGGLVSFLDYLNDHEWAMVLFHRWFDWYYKSSQYSDKNLPEAIHSGNEIMIKCDTYAVIPDKGLIRSYYVRAAESILGDLGLQSDPDMVTFINAILKALSK